MLINKTFSLIRCKILIMLLFFKFLLTKQPVQLTERAAAIYLGDNFYFKTLRQLTRLPIIVVS